MSTFPQEELVVGKRPKLHKAETSGLQSSSSTSSRSTGKSSAKPAASDTTTSTIPVNLDRLFDLDAAVDGTMMKYTVADLIREEGKMVESERSLTDGAKQHHTVETLSQLGFDIPMDAVITEGIATVEMQPSQVFDMLRLLTKQTHPNDSDDETDSLFDSDEDYEGECDDFYRKRASRNKVKRLTTTKGIVDFKEYIHGTPGEVNWNLWIDIERASLIADKSELSRCVHMIVCVWMLQCVMGKLLPCLDEYANAAL